MPDQITLKAINLLREADPNLDEMNSLDKFIAHQSEVIKMYKQFEGHPQAEKLKPCLLYTSPSPRDRTRSRMPSSA